MVARITVPHSIHRALSYNEQKVQKGVAECLHGENFLKEAPEMCFSEKLQRFEHLIALNKRATTNTVHLSLNFDVGERFEKEKLIEMAKAFMQQIGFGAQPYLIYEHRDAGHPHLHVVSTNIQSDGKRISLHNIGRNEVNRARKEMEIIYGLMKAGEKKQRKTEQNKPLPVQRVVYGKEETKQSIITVLHHVLHQYRYTSLHELNAVLRLYNVYADRGSEEGRIYQNKGLVYRILNEKGNKIGVPIKASAIEDKPTLAFLEKKFRENEALREEHKKGLKTTINWTLLKPNQTLAQFIHFLEKERISTVVHRNNAGIVYGLTFIDHNTRCIFKDSDLGKEYSAQKILERLGVQQTREQRLQQQPFPAPTSANATAVYSSASYKKEVPEHSDGNELKDGIDKALALLLRSEQQYDHIPRELKEEGVKKKRHLPGHL